MIIERLRLAAWRSNYGHNTALIVKFESTMRGLTVSYVQGKHLHTEHYAKNVRIELFSDKMRGRFVSTTDRTVMNTSGSTHLAASPAYIIDKRKVGMNVKHVFTTHEGP